jgi:glucosyl-3-phosphoglycerate synthase
VVRSLFASDFDVAGLVERKGDTVVSVCLPAHDEAATVGDIVAAIVDTLGPPGAGLVDEVLVVDDRSTDSTRVVAEKAGARVVGTNEVLPETGTWRGKGEALWKSVAAARGDLLVWVDADISDFDLAFIVGLLGPLLTDPSIVFTKGHYERPGADELIGGGRVTELMARPLLSLYFPDLVGVVQPLSGEYGARRTVMEQLEFAGGYGVDIALLVDIAADWGVDRMVQVDLGRRVHRNRTISELGVQSLEVLHAALRRAGVDPPEVQALVHPAHPDGEVLTHDRPPLLEVPGYRRPQRPT